MTVVVAALLIFSIIAVHELGHALLMRKYGVPIKEICLLGVGPRLVSFTWPWLFGQTPLTVRLIPIGAFVRPEQPLEEVVSAQELEHIYAGGIAANFTYAGILVLVYAPFAYIQDPTLDMLWAILIGSPLMVIVCSGIGMAMWKFAAFANWVVVITGALTLALVIHAVMSAPVSKALGGPVSIGIDIAQIKSYHKAVDFAFMMSINLAIVNALPLPPLDGGRVLLSILDRKHPVMMERYGNLLEAILLCGALAFIVTALGSDVVSFL